MRAVAKILHSYEAGSDSWPSALADVLVELRALEADFERAFPAALEILPPPADWSPLNRLHRPAFVFLRRQLEAAWYDRPAINVYCPLCDAALEVGVRHECTA